MDPVTGNSLILELLQYEDSIPGSDGDDAALHILQYFLTEVGEFNQAMSTNMLFAQSFPPQVLYVLSVLLCVQTLFYMTYGYI